MNKYIYDIAISFLARDESIALQISAHLKERYKLFVYSEQQKSLAGKDGEGAFRKVFEHEAKLVVVLYRSEWGTTPWTRMEQQGIRDRAYNAGYDFVTFIALEDQPQMPDWFPKQRLYSNYPRFGIEQVVAVIDSRAQEAQIQSRELSVLEKAVQLEHRRRFEKDRDTYLNSHQGGQDARTLFEALTLGLRERFKQLSDVLPTLQLKELPAHGYFVMAGIGPCLTVNYKQPYINSVEGCSLDIALHVGCPPLPGYWNFEDSVKVASKSMTIDRTETLPICWNANKRTYNNDEAVEYIADFWLKHQPNGRP